ncbi:hypothetical protein [Actinokineospora enzanensis]|uniref:hypothetical protein n=1 Tax=Actinokineospora enzanensis TaxID=155975 RepID=UPI00036CD168|nr:hypothetical protein [Actinokineospora enzanensis]
MTGPTRLGRRAGDDLVHHWKADPAPGVMETECDISVPAAAVTWGIAGPLCGRCLVAVGERLPDTLRWMD